MRRIVAVVALASVLALAGCSTLPAGLDGNLTNGWSLIPVPVATLPIVGDCYQVDYADLQTDPPVPCTSAHQDEVVKVGTFADGDVNNEAPPISGSDAVENAYGVCVSAADTYLGGEFHSGLFSVGVLVPDQSAWNGHARWFGCELQEIIGPADYDPQDSEVSLKGALAHGGGLRIGCVGWTVHKDYLDDFASASCAKPHQGEYAGVYNATDIPYPSTKLFDEIAGSGCNGVVEKFLGSPRDGNESVGVVWTYTDEGFWDQGDHYIRCFAAAYVGHRFIGSVRGIGRRTPKG